MYIKISQYSVTIKIFTLILLLYSYINYNVVQWTCSHSSYYYIDTSITMLFLQEEAVTIYGQVAKVPIWVIAITSPTGCGNFQGEDWCRSPTTTGHQANQIYPGSQYWNYGHPGITVMTILMIMSWTVLFVR